MTPESVIAPGTRIGDYEIVRHLGKGGMGSVYLAQHTISNRLDALKLLPEGISEDSDAYARFLREIQILAGLKHPNICSLYTAFTSVSHFVMVMEYVEGRSLSEVLQGGGLAIPQAVRLGMQVLDALASAHRRNIVHRDIKPANIMITAEGEAKLVDFGIARSEAFTRLTQTNMVLGSMAWMSPEHIGGKTLDGRSDLYALGVVLYEAAAGRLPFSGDPAALVGQHLYVLPDPPRQVNARIPESLNHVILRALEKAPGARYQSAGEFKAALEVVLREIAAVGRVVRQPAPPPPTTAGTPNPSAMPAAVPPVQPDPLPARLENPPTLAPEPETPKESQAPPAAALPAIPGAARPGSRGESLASGGSARRFLVPAVVLASVMVLAGTVLAVRAYWENRPIPPQTGAETVPTRESIPVLLEPQAGESMPPLNLGNGVQMEFVYIRAGSFWMGCSPGDTECEEDEKVDEENPRRRVEITKPFEMGKYEVTQAEWETVMGMESNRSEFKGPRRPVERVSWENVQEFLRRLNVRNDGYRYRLPSEVEWEYAARAGAEGKYYGTNLRNLAWFGDNSGEQMLDSQALWERVGRRVGPYREEIKKGNPGTQSVGGKQPNGWGLYDMLGNVYEWCEDRYEASYYQAGENRDPKGPGPGPGEYQVVRGGSWFNNLRGLRLSRRFGVAPSFRNDYIGFRCVREAN